MAQITVHLHLQVEPKLHEQIESRARLEGVSKSEVIRKALESYLRKENE